MENKKVGYLLIGIAVLLVGIVFLFQNALLKINAATCTSPDHSLSCPMNAGITQQTFLSLGIVGLLVIVGLVLIFSKPDEKVIVKTKKVTEKKKKIDKSSLDKDEAKVVSLLEKESGGMFQADLKEKLEIGKVKLTRLLDKLEAKQIIERKRRGMNNIVILKS